MCVPALMDIPKWAGRQDNAPIRADTFNYAVGLKMIEEPASNLQTQLWGFWRAVVPGSAGTMFKRADQCVGEMNGIDAWRRLVRHIGHGRGLRLDDLRHEMELMHLKLVTSLADVEQGVAAFENSIYEFAQAGGTPPPDKEMKDDLSRMLPERVQLDLLWSASDQTKGFTQFRDLVVTASAKMLNIQKPQRGIHQVAPEQPGVNARLPVYSRQRATGARG